MEVVGHVMNIARPGRREGWAALGVVVTDMVSTTFTNATPGYSRIADL
jgi:hypothetical protein